MAASTNDIVPQAQPMCLNLRQAQPICLREGKEKDKEKEEDKSSEGDKSSDTWDVFFLQRCTRKVKLVRRDTWDIRYKNHPEHDADSYSKNGHPPNKLINTGLNGILEIRDWNQTPCRHGVACTAHAHGRCWFLHGGEEIEVAAGSPLRLRQIKSSSEAIDGRYSDLSPM